MTKHGDLLLIVLIAALFFGCSTSNKSNDSADTSVGNQDTTADSVEDETSSTDESTEDDDTSTTATDGSTGGTGGIDDETGTTDDSGGLTGDGTDDTGSTDVVECTVEGETSDVPCGFNDRGVKRQTCTGGIWVSMACVDVDICKDGDEMTDTCGVMGSRTDVCTNGQWQTGECEDSYVDPGEVIPNASEGKFLYFTAKKVDDKYNSDLYLLDMTGDVATTVQLTRTDNINESSPSSPLNNSFMIYADGDYSDVQFSDIRWVSLGSDGHPISATDKQILDTEIESCDFSTFKLGKGNPAVSLDGTEMVFVNTYAHDVDLEGCPLLAYQLSRATLDTSGNAGPIENIGWDEGSEPGPMISKPMSPIYLYDTKRIVVSVFGFDQHQWSSEIQLCTEDCTNFGDWDWLTYLALWSSSNTAQRCLAANPVSDEISFFRQFSGSEFDSGIYTSGDLASAGPHPTYGPYAVLDTTETFVSNFAGAEHMTYAQRPLSYSPDGKLIAVAITFIKDTLKDERYSEIGILDKATGELVAKFDFEGELREIDGLLWR